MLQSNTFKCHIPVEIIKGKNSQGRATMSMQGVASTISTDSDGENLDPVGFDSEYFLQNGFMNWNHQTNKDPSAIVGRPTEAKVVKGNYQIKYDLFANSEKAQQVYALQEVLEQEGLALGLSIEGKVLERDPNNNKHITKARITGCAITPNPKNADTVTQIMKGESYTALTDVESDDDEGKKEKSLSAGSSSGKAITKESLDGDLKNLAGPKKLKKSEVIDKIARDLPSLTKELVEGIYNLTSKIQKSIDMSDTTQTPEVTEESLSKAYEVLGLSPTGEKIVEVIEKGAFDELNPEELAAKKAELQKSLEDILALESPEVVVVDQVAAAEAIVAAANIEKAIEVPAVAVLEKAITVDNSNDDLIKSLTGVIQTEINGATQATDTKFKATGELLKGFSETLSGLTDRLNTIETQSPGRRSITTQKQHVIEKSFSNEEEGSLAEGEQYVSVSGNKAAIAKALTDSWEEGGRTDNQLQKSILTLDTTGKANATIISKAKEMGMILVP
jgi:hypothetical protein